MSEQGSTRYPRTFGGLVGSMIVLVIVVVPIVLLTHWWAGAQRNASGGTAPLTPAVDYLSVVGEVQEAGKTLAYPPTLPSGWTPTSADWDVVTDNTRPQWRLGILVPGQQFAGLYEQNASEQSLVQETVGDDARRGGDVTLQTAVGSRWSTWHATDGDVGYATRQGTSTLVVYGTSDADVRTLMGLLTTAPVASASAAPHS